MGSRLQSASAVEKHEEVTEQQMERGARVRGPVALVSTNNGGNKRTEFVKRDLNAAIHRRKCAVLQTRPPDSTRMNFIGQALKVELFERKLDAVVGGRL